MKRIIILLTAVAATVFLLTPAFSLEKVEDDGIVRLDVPDLQPYERPASLFYHDSHIEAGLDDCSVCHHVYENGVLIAGEYDEELACADCHKVKATPENDVPLQQAYHKRCWGCHDQTGQGPVTCGECHKKESAQ